ncbi:MAG: DUF3800 domain-containing protein [Xanthobacteraceae bacterium]
MRFVFTDEGGISRDEPFVVVAGVFVHGDWQLIPLENELERLKQKHIPRENQSGFIFHAKDIWSGKKGIFQDRGKWPLSRRLAILRDLARVPRRLGIPIVYEYVERAKFDLSEEAKKVGRAPTSSEHSVAAHAVTFASCTLRIEQCMRAKWPAEVAQIIAEDNAQVRALVKGAVQKFRYPSEGEGELIANNVLPLQSIRGSVHFAEKVESRPLQLADICAFVIRAHLTKNKHIGPLYQRIRSNFVLVPTEEANLWMRVSAETSPLFAGWPQGQRV